MTKEGEVVKKSYKAEFAVVLELLSGGELLFYVMTCRGFPEKIGRYYFQQMVEALEQIHEAGYAHRDIKLNNILLGDDLNLKVADFGFAGFL